MRRCHRGPGDGVGCRVGRRPRRRDRTSRREQVEAASEVRVRRTRVSVGGGTDRECRGSARRRVVTGVGVAVARRHHDRDGVIGGALDRGVNRGAGTTA